MNVVLRGVWVAGLTLMALGARAQVPEHGHGYGGPGPQAHPPGQHYDVRYSHNYYYPAHGAYVTTLPHGPVVINRPGGNYYYAGGVWYRPYGPSFVVVSAPIGVFVPVLPAYYTTLWAGGAPYYYANDTYYTWSPEQNGYQVVDPPSQTGYPPADSTNAPAPAAASTPADELYAYPQAGQSAEQQSQDKYECHKWAAGQSGFDPTQTGGGAAPDQSGSARENYQRAMSACLEGRGYSVR